MNTLVLCTVIALSADPQGFRYVADSTLSDNGLDVVAPRESWASNPVTNSVTHSVTLPKGSGWRTLPHQGLVFGTVILTCPSDSQLDCTDADLHGHSVNISADGNAPLIDHAGGRIRLPVGNREFVVSYSYTDKPGRLLREWGPADPVTPSMVLGSPHWAATLATARGRPVLFEGETINSLLELPDQSTVDGTLRIPTAELLQRMRIDSGSPDRRWGYATRLHQALGQGMPHVTCKSGATQITFGRFEVYADRLPAAFWYEVFRVPDPTNPNDLPVDWVAAEVRNSFQNSPVGAGIAFIAQNGRVVKNLRVDADAIYVHDMPGSCVLSDVAVYWDVTLLHLGSSYCGRPFYEVTGHIGTLILEGHSRTSMARMATNTKIDFLRYRSLNLVNPASPAADQEGLIGSSDVRGDGEIHLPYFDLDLRGSASKTATGFGASGIYRGTIRGGGIAFHAKARGAISATVHATVIDGGRFMPQWSWSGPTAGVPSADLPTSTANWANLDATIIWRRVDDRPAVDWSNYFDYITKADTPMVLRVKRNPSHPVGHEQRAKFTVIGEHWGVFGGLHLPDVGDTSPADVVPTYVELTGSFNNLFCEFLGFREGYKEATPGNLADYPIRVLCHDSTINWFSPHEPFRGNDCDKQLTVLKFLNVKTHDRGDGLGVMRSEARGYAAGPGDYPTDLFWRPKHWLGNGTWKQRPKADPRDWRRPVWVASSAGAWEGKVSP